MNIPIQISEPRALILLLTIPIVVALGVLSTRARPRDRVRIGTSTLIRSLILILIACALAGLQLVSAGGPLNVVFLIDQSSSVSQANQDAAAQYVQRALAAMGPDDRAGVVLFGEQAIVDRALSSDSEWKPFGENPAATATNIQEAIQAGVALFPEGGSRRLVLLTDGAETAGKAAEQARLAANSGVQLSVVPMGTQAQNEVAVDKVASPNEIPAGQQFEVQALIKSSTDRTATVNLLDNDEPAGQQEVQLKTGDNAVRFSVKPPREGFHIFKVRVTSADDQYAQNNEASSYTMLRKAPSVLIVAGSPADGEPLKQALAASQVDATIIAPDSMPHKDESLAQYDAVVLANASASSLTVEGQEALQRFVRDQGHGLVMLGGDLSYGAGGYLRSPVEEILPVNMDVRASEQRASLALSFVTDKSGSMGRCHCGGAQQFNPSMRSEFGVSKVEIAKQAISKAAAILNSSDKVGVVGFDDAARWLVNIESMGVLGRGQLEADLKPMTADGNTNVHSGLQTAVDGLKGTDAQIKHIILLSDGWSKQADYSGLLNDMAAQNITLSTVGAGQGADPLLKQLADKGGGQYYVAEDVNTIPDIFLKETVRLAGSYYVEKPFKPIVTRASPILKGLEADALPSLLGYNSATLKPNAEQIIKSPAGDPILAQWQYGLGRSVAWTPDVKGRWATDWVKWPLFAQFAGQMISWTIPKETSPGLDTSLTTLGSSSPGTQDVGVRVNSEDTSGAPRNFLDTTITVTSTNQTSRASPLVQQSPDVYGGVLKDLQQGVYRAQIVQRDPSDGKVLATQATGVIVPYPSEYRFSTTSAAEAKALLSDLAQLGGGKQLDIAQPSAAFVHDIASQPRPIPLWPWLLLTAILLFPIDVAVRRLTITRTDLRVALSVLRRGHT